MPGYLRAQVIAMYDYIKSEMPDIFFVQNTTGPYPINFAANPYPLSAVTTDSNNRALHPADGEFDRGAPTATQRQPATASRATPG